MHSTIMLLDPQSYIKSICFFQIYDITDIGKHSKYLPFYSIAKASCGTMGTKTFSLSGLSATAHSEDKQATSKL